MKKTNHTLLIVVLLLSVVGALAFTFKDAIAKMLKKKDVQPTAGIEITKETTPNPVVIIEKEKADPVLVDYWNLDKDKMLKKGSSGNEVRYLQGMINKALKLKKLPLIGVDGKFGNQTYNSLKSLIGKTQITLSEAATLFVNALKK